MPLKNVSGQSYKVTIGTFGSSLVVQMYIKTHICLVCMKDPIEGMSGSGRPFSLHQNLSERCIDKENILVGIKIRHVALLVTAISPQDRNLPRKAVV